MDKLNASGLKRDPGVISKYFKTIGDSIVVTNDIQVIFSDRYINKGLAIMGSTVKLMSIYAIVDDSNNYSVVNIPIMIELTPSNIKDVEINGKVYKALIFEAGSTYTENRNLVINNDFLFDLFDEFIIKGNIPWYMGYEDLMSIFQEAKKYADTNIGDNPLALELIASILARSPKDKTKFYRMILEKPSDANKIKPEYIGLMNIYYTFDSTTAKVVGSYMSKGITSAIVNPEDESTVIEDILKA